MRPAVFVPALAVFFAALLGLDHFASFREQLGLGAAAFAVLLAACLRQPAERRAQVAVVVAVATCFEVLGSIIWGVYRYRLGNLPLFVPPAHGLVYLTGFALSRSAPVVRFPRAFVGAALAGAVGWGVAGLTVLPRTDVIGAFGVLVFSVFLLRCSKPTVLAGVFLVVAALELYGTAIGTWRWAPLVPGLGLPDGNPPSGAVSGYVIFDLAAMALAPALLRLLRRLAGGLRPGAAEAHAG